MSERLFPILDEPGVKVPWTMIAPHEGQARRNHSQTLERLAERGGLSFYEAFAVLSDLSWPELEKMTSNLSKGTVRAKLERMIRDWRETHIAVKAIPQIVRDVAELPDRESSGNWPDAMIVTAEELTGILERHLGRGGRA